MPPVPVVARSKARTVFGLSNIGIAGSNPTRGMDVCPRFSVLCYPVYVAALRRANPPSKESFQMSKNRFINFRSQILNRNRPEILIQIFYLALVSIPSVEMYVMDLPVFLRTKRSNMNSHSHVIDIATRCR
jgi:hypothetical protein